MSEFVREDSIRGTVLEKILAAKKKQVAARKEQEPLESFLESLESSDRSLEEALKSRETAFIMECKKASPSKGLIRPEFSPAEIGGIYRHYAQGVSVLTEEEFFQGKMEYLPEVRKSSGRPVICKDFITDPYQVFLARKYQADAVLLMLSVLTDEGWKALAGVAESLKMDVITEASNEEEVARAAALGARIIGINSRNLKDLTVDLDRVKKLAPLIPADRVRLSESGISTHAQVLELAPLVNGFLVGSSLTGEEDISAACRRLVYGQVKICGLTRHADAREAFLRGASWGGLIFAPGSPRRVSPKHARNIMFGNDLKFAGVFVDQDPGFIADTASSLGLKAVQLHGSETAEDLKTLREFLPEGTEIWKALPVENGAFPEDQVREFLPLADRFLLDTRSGDTFGGTGVAYDPAVLRKFADLLFSLDTSGDEEPIRRRRARDRIIAAGGLSEENIVPAMAEGVFMLDVNSGAESAPGIKDPEKIRNIFRKLRTYKSV